MPKALLDMCEEAKARNEDNPFPEIDIIISIGGQDRSQDVVIANLIDKFKKDVSHVVSRNTSDFASDGIQVLVEDTQPSGDN